MKKLTRALAIIMAMLFGLVVGVYLSVSISSKGRLGSKPVEQISAYTLEEYLEDQRAEPTPTPEPVQQEEVVEEVPQPVQETVPESTPEPTPLPTPEPTLEPTLEPFVEEEQVLEVVTPNYVTQEYIEYTEEPQLDPLSVAEDLVFDVVVDESTPGEDLVFEIVLDDPVVTEIFIEDSYGNLHIDELNIQVALFYTDDASQFQIIVDAENSACMFDWNTNTLIADHCYQEFYSLSDVTPGMYARIITPYESYDYICVQVVPNGWNTGTNLTYNDFVPIEYDYQNSLVIYTCNFDSTVTITIWTLL